MKWTGKQNTAGFSLVEVLVAIAIIGIITVPVCGSLILAGRLNAQSQAVLTAKLKVQTAVESLMEDGVWEASDDYRGGEFPDVTVKTEEQMEGTEKLPYYKVTVSDEGTDPLVTMETFIRAVDAPAPEGGGGE